MDNVEKDCLLRTGVHGLDEILYGGLEPERLYLVEGDPGSGKTTLALQFLLEGARRGETVLHLTMSETLNELESTFRSHGWSMEGLHVVELNVSEGEVGPEEQYTMFHSSEVELGNLMRRILEEVDRLGARRLVIDSLAELRLVAQNPLWYRRQILALKQHFTGRGCTALLLDEAGERLGFNVQTVAHGVVSLFRKLPAFGGERRHLQVVKMRGRSYQGGYHDYKIEQGGLQIFPRLVALEHQRSFERELVESGIPELDTLLCGGIDRGTSTLLTGAAGTGKSSLATQYAFTALGRGETVAFFHFDESRENFLARSRGLGMDFSAHLNSGRISSQQIDPAELSPGEFSATVRKAVEKDKACLIVIDSLNGYLNAMPEERFLVTQLHELLTYLGQMGVTTLLIVAQHGLVGADTAAPVDVSYLSDAVILLRYFESQGEVRQAVSVVKKRTGSHERTIREIKITSGGIRIGEPLRQFQGVLQGNPIFRGGQDPLMDSDAD
ncbi:MAG: ATPase domain-containing protein [Syntrophotaleaceae bacterium]